MQKRHRSVVAVAVLLSAALLSGCQWWGQVGFSAARTRFHPFEKAIGVDNVDRLQERWSVPLGGVVGDPVVFGSGRRGTRVFVNTNGIDANGNWFAVSTPSVPEPGLAGGQSRRCRIIQGSDSLVTSATRSGCRGRGLHRDRSGRWFPTAVEGQLDAFDAVSGDPVWTSTVPSPRAGSSAHRPWPVGGSTPTTSSAAASGKSVSEGSRPGTPPPASRAGSASGSAVTSAPARSQ